MIENEVRMHERRSREGQNSRRTGRVAQWRTGAYLRASLVLTAVNQPMDSTSNHADTTTILVTFFLNSFSSPSDAVFDWFFQWFNFDASFCCIPSFGAGRSALHEEYCEKEKGAYIEPQREEIKVSCGVPWCICYIFQYRAHIIPVVYSNYPSFHIKMILSFHIVLIFLIFNSASAADLSFFTDEDDDVPLFLDPSSVDEDIFSDAADTNIFTVNLNFPDQDLLLSSDFLLSSCLLDETFQPALQARGGGADCKTTPSSPLTIPSLPTLNDIENTLEPNPNQPGGPEKNRPTGPYLVIQVPHQGELGANEPEYYCNLYVTPYYPPAPFTIPVCGVGDASDRFGSRGFLYSVVDRARIRQSFRFKWPLCYLFLLFFPRKMRKEKERFMISS